MQHHKYKTGERPSPHFHAKDKPGKVMIGNDGNEYVSRKDKNGIYKWYKVSLCKTAEKYYSQFPDYVHPKYKFDKIDKKLIDITNELAEINIHFLTITWEEAAKFIDNAWEVAQEKIMSEDDNIIFYTENSLYHAKRDGILYIQHNLTHKKIKDTVYNIFKKHLGDNFSWAKNDRSTLQIKLMV